MTDRRRSRAPLRRSSTPERILSAGLATATCVGVVGLLGARTIEANATSASEPTAEQVEATPEVGTSTATSAGEPTTASGLNQADLDAYAAALAVEKERLDAYRAKLVRTAKKLKRQIAAGNAMAVVPSRQSTSVSASSSGSSGAASRKPAAQPQAQSGKAAQPAPAAKPAPQPTAAPAPQPAAKPQSTTKGS